MAKLRLDAGLSADQLGQLVNVAGKTIRLIEKGHVPGPRIQYAIASYFEQRPTDIWPLSTQVSA